MKTAKPSIAKIVAVVVILTAGRARAGDLTPPGAPGPTMHTLEEIYQQLLTATQHVASLQQQVADLRERMLSAGMQQTSGDMVLIPAGSFIMGATTNVGHESYADEVPQHTVTLSAFYMDKYEVTSNLWAEVYTWATNRGYSFENAGTGKAGDHPVQTVNWYDCVAWANARSQHDGFTPCYTNADGTLYTNSTVAFGGGCNWTASGYRLPTEAEWEKAARGGVANRRFPWDDVNTIQHVRANYRANSEYSYDTSPTTAYHPDYESGEEPYTSPVGSFAPNGYGLYDMAGNVTEWCWDWYDSTYYLNSPPANPRGPETGIDRVKRGGDWDLYANANRVAFRWIFAEGEDRPRLAYEFFGFRTVRVAQKTP